ncbi:MAG: flagellar protein FlgN [Proteobacteria bacterium]|nr:flagellar protein FlgN [Pseudomonadota bacterium]
MPDQTEINITARVRKSLIQLNALLEQERAAILKGDAFTVAELASQKEQIARFLNEENQSKDSPNPRFPEVADLARSVFELAQLNHMLLKQMYQHYHGMLELFMRLSGQEATYGPDGMVNIGPSTLKNSKILA